MNRSKLIGFLASILVIGGVWASGQKEAKPGSNPGVLMPRDEPKFKQAMKDIWVVRTFAHFQEKGLVAKIQSRMPCNIFILERGEDLIVFDAGWSGEDNFRNFTDALRAMGREPKDIKYLVISHWHLDHTGLANQIKQISNCQVVAQEKDAPYMTHEKKLTRQEIETKLEQAGFWTRTFAKIAFRVMGGAEPGSDLPVQADAFPVDILVQEELTIGTWKILHTPGHSAGSLALFEPERKILLVGNWALGVASTDPNAKSSQGGADLLGNFAPDGDAQALADSVSKLKALNPEAILFSHAGKLP